MRWDESDERLLIEDEYRSQTGVFEMNEVTITLEPATEPTEQEIIERIAQMSDEEVRARLEQLLNEVSA
jgi:hypothetical protein